MEFRPVCFGTGRRICRRKRYRRGSLSDRDRGSKGLDVGCGSAALTIAVAKRNRQATVTGLDRWGKEYASFSKSLCENNARIEGVAENTSFMQGDACSLPFADETFDAVTSNYCYHNIPSSDRQAIILETLRVLKKGGTSGGKEING